MRTFLLLFCLLLVSSSATAQKFTEVTHLGRLHLKVETRSATYLYDPVAGGFSSIIDPAGADWVAYRDTPWGEYPASAASSYRGVPNLVFRGDDDGAGHPGHKKCKSELRDGKIYTETLSGEWAWNWSFTRKGAILAVTKVPAGKKYWFLYEGPAGGRYQPKTTYWATGLTPPSYAIPDHFTGGTHRDYHQLMYFGQDDSRYVFGMLQATPDTHRDHISYLGNEEIGAANSPDGMVVAGFGRDEGATPLLEDPQIFAIAIIKKGKARRIKKTLHKLGKADK
ncbi:hypothetical protein [Lewinella sp. 4G2]|uniref:hypothetical protein n=1 Tax=Lewinella sp. 4G2 TaxID=1803372 RepID=UPI0007B47BEB|nr:hypothetical protein [Lewinella sp. 4G2]OAV44384.1 hypothetical protein A3850_007690 [Lewinella sp. 4G2]